MASNTTSESTVTLSQESTVPAVRILQFDTDPVGRVAQAVNVFRGDAMVWLDLVTLQGRGGTEVKVGIAYGSDAARDVDTWNISAPTGLLGLGWQLPYEQIVADHQGSVSPWDARYFLLGSDGSVRRLRCVEQTSSAWIFELEQYEFWDIRYFPATSCWQIKQADGTVRIYGATAAARRRGVLWGGARGNWSDATIQGDQTTFDAGWGLSEVKNLWGDSITFEYESVEVPVGAAPGAASYTRASYLTAINAPGGRRLELDYAEKVYTSDVREYEDAHRDPERPSIVAFQDRYETRYLRSITVLAADGSGEAQTTLSFTYSLVKLADGPGDPAYLYKRYLRAITPVSAQGDLQPGMLFDYEGVDGVGGKSPVHPGAMHAMTYPEGGTVKLTYAHVPIEGTDRRRQLSQDDTSTGVPRVYFGADYAVIVRYDEARGRKLAVNVYDWNGRWIGSQPLVQLLAGSLDMASLQVEPRGDWFLLVGKVTGLPTGPAIVAWALRRRFGRFGDWTSTAIEMPSLALSEDYQVIAGESFVVAAATDQREILRYRWDARARAWVPEPVSPSEVGAYSLGAGPSFFTLAVYLAGANQARTTLFGLSAAGDQWTQTELDGFGPVLWEKDYPRLSWSAGGNIAAATYLISKEGEGEDETVVVGVRVYTWDRDFQRFHVEVLSPDRRSVSSIEPFAISFVSRSLVANASRLQRYNGNGWVAGTLGSFESGKAAAGFAFADDLAIGTDDAGSAAVAYSPYDGVFLPEVHVPGSQGPRQPTIHGVYVSIRSNLYYREPTGRLRVIGGVPAEAERLANHAPGYFVYALPGGKSFVLRVKNGVPASLADRVDERVFPDEIGPGRTLTSENAFATFTGATFDEAKTIVLYRLVDDAFTGAIVDTVVVSATVDDKLGGEVTTTFTRPAGGTTGVYGLSGQYGQVVTAIASATGAARPFGWTTTDFFDGLSPSSTPDEPTAAFSGLTRQKRTYDAAGKLVQSETLEWEAARSIVNLVTGKPMNLVGAWVRKKRAVTSVYGGDTGPAGPLTSTAETLYDDGCGAARTTRTNNVDGAGAAQTLEETSLFTHEQYSALRDAHVWSVAVQKTTTVNGQMTARTSTTWRDDWPRPGGGTVEAWAPYRTYKARRKGASLSPSDWSNQTVPPAADFWLEGQIDRRDAFGNVLESLGPTGLRSCRSYDDAGRFVVSAFDGAALSDVTYLGFEAYEPLQGWTLGGTQAQLRSAIEAGDAHSGSQALRMPAKSSQALVWSGSIAKPGGRRFVLSAWVKTGAGAAGGGTWTISVNQAVSRTVTAGPTNGAWTQVIGKVDLPAGSAAAAVTLSLKAPAANALLVDDVRFSPILSDFTAAVANPVTLDKIARIATSGETDRALVGPFSVPFAEVAPDGAVITATARYRSRLGGGGQQGVPQPNAMLTVKPRSWGFHQSFDIGDAWRNGWTSTDMAAWRAERGALVHTAGAEGKVVYQGIPAARASFGMALQVSAGKLEKDLGVSFGGCSLRWRPSRAAWGLVTTAGGTMQWLPPRKILGVSWANHHAALDQGQLAPALADRFAAAGLPLSSASAVTVTQAGQSWTIAGGPTPTYYLVRDPDDATWIDVVLAPSTWCLFVRGADVILFADGGRALSARLPAPAERQIGLVASDEVRLSNMVFFTDPSLEILYRDGCDRSVQRQVADETGFLGSATLYDPGGRLAMTTMIARPDPAPDKLGAYSSDLAIYDWSTNTFLGRVLAQNPAAGLYPFARARTEASPLAREVERGLPGADFAITGAASGHTTRFAYALNDGSWGLASGQFLQETTVDPSGITRVEVKDRRGMMVRSAVMTKTSPATWDVTRYKYDLAGRLVRLVTPAGATVEQTYDFLGNVVQKVSSDTGAPGASGRTRRLYDSFSRVRFEMDPRGEACAPQYIKFWKYDTKSRVVAEGCLAHAWDAELGSRVDQADWPAAPPTNQYTYDGVDRPDLLALGRLVQADSARELTAPAETDPFAATETFDYDLRGRAVLVRLRVPTFAEIDYDLRYDLDNQDDVTAVHTPLSSGGAGSSVGFARDLVGRVTDVQLGGAKVASYSYHPNGEVARETTFDAGLQLGESVFEYNPPGWSTRILGPCLDETTQYTSGGAAGEGYFNGSPARITTAARGPNAARDQRFAYDKLGRLALAVEGHNELSYEYDTNGNLTRIGDLSPHYGGNDWSLSVQGGAGSSSYTWDPNGKVAARTAIAELPALSLSHDCFSGMPLRVTSTPLPLAAAAEPRLSDPAPCTVELRYDYLRRRLLRTLENGSGKSSRLYLRGASPGAVAEIDSDGSVRLYAEGPRGLCAILAPEGVRYVATDSLGSVRAVYDPSRQILAGCDYQPFGAAWGADFGVSPAAFEVRYTGRALDPTGLYDLRARLYDPAVGRFISPDPREQFLSPYVYAGNTPLLVTDPSGELIMVFLGAIMSAITAVATAVVVGAVAGAVVGGVQAIVTIAETGLSGGRAAGVFFGFLALGAGTGAVSGFSGGVVSVATSTVAASVAAGAIASAVTGSLTGAVGGAGQAALVGGDPRRGAGFSAFSGVISGLVGGFIGGFGATAAAKSSVPFTNLIKVTGGTTGGASGSLLSNAAQGKDGEALLSATLKGAAYGALRSFSQVACKTLIALPAPPVGHNQPEWVPYASQEGDVLE